MSNESDPPAIHQTPSHHQPQDHHPDCPFCTIATQFQPISPQDSSNKEWDPDKLVPPSYMLLSTEHIIAFLDIAPLTRGHVLVAPRKHREKMGDLRGEEMAEIGRMLPLLARSVLKSVLPDIPHDEADYNIVQNNGPGAAQVIPHVHFHIIPRPPLNYRPPTPPPPPPPGSNSDSSPSSNPTHTPASSQPPPRRSQYPPSRLPKGIQQSYIQFGRGSRHELDDDDAADLIRSMRENVRDEWTTEHDAGPRTGSAASDPAAANPQGTSETVVARFLGGVEDAAWIEGSGGLVSNLERRGRGGGKL